MKTRPACGAHVHTGHNADKSHAQKGASTQPAVYRQCTFRHASAPLGAPSGGTTRSTALQRRPPPRRRSTSSTQGQDNANDNQVDQDISGDTGGETLGGDPDQRRQKPHHHGFDQEPGGDMPRPPVERRARGGSKSRQPLKGRVPPRRPQESPSQILTRAGLADIAAPLLRAAKQPGNADELLRALTAVLVACAPPRAEQPAGAPSPTAVKLAALQLYLASQDHTPVEPLTLQDVKVLLMAHPPKPLPADMTGTQRTRAENDNLRRPLELLDATRPRTPAQRQRAIETLNLLARS